MKHGIPSWNHGPAPVPMSVRHYSRMAERYDETVSACGYNLAKLIFEAGSKARSSTNINVLDLGIGSGLSSIMFAGQGNVITGVDGSLEMLKICERKNFADSLVHADLSSGILPAFPGKFDLVICAGLFEFVLYPERFLKSVRDVMADQAVLVIAIRDLALNPDLQSRREKDLLVDPRSLDDHGILAVYHDWPSTMSSLASLGFRILSERAVFAYRSPTQGVDTINRLVTCRLVGHSRDNERARGRDETIGDRRRGETCQAAAPRARANGSRRPS